ncbi:hypothetical protein BD324DRAFT_640506 [Kockovaella imperatae]|uniref:Pyridoxal phosphate homeostasis protein n=1 Tax=Kockovaella imperatae TaxID=4999 RepID=A0A1Y1USA7_9TREE|nr:hypothetical protein BD324DRAFT_640506 [Kockovaella imperatae]ORX40517.1 hypothetical protein BD324DRAFT_640506 [Kockovaella imperatae]
MTDLSLSYSPQRAEELKENMKGVLDDIAAVGNARLVPISKLKPASDIKALYDAGYRHFGENYIQEMVDKAEVLPSDIRWHFVGALQSNKAKLAASVPNLFLLETFSSVKLADAVQKHLPERAEPLNVYIQINTSSEDSKSGLPPLTSSSTKSDPAAELAIHIRDHCPGLKLLGLMTIGSWEASHDPSKPNPDFETLKSTRKELLRLLESDQELELSMGMSADFVQAVKEGSSSVRVGTRIFGERPPKNA